MLRRVYRRLKGWRFFKRALERFLHWRMGWLLLGLSHHLSDRLGEGSRKNERPVLSEGQ
jgi:hypothetical protein